jgi:hypothetical protein
MRPTTDEMPGQDDRRTVERQAITQLTLVVLVVTALTIFVLGAPSNFTPAALNFAYTPSTSATAKLI